MSAHSKDFLVPINLPQSTKKLIKIRTSLAFNWGMIQTITTTHLQRRTISNFKE
jgi:hypothetical protein